jgi:sulfate/thiosulfate transport system substrate-binding protein
MTRRDLALTLVLLLALAGLAGCGRARPPVANRKPATLVLAAYTVPREAYQNAVLPAFRAYWKAKTGQDVIFTDTYEPSGAQSRAICTGLEADVAALSLAPDLDRIRAKNLITREWTLLPHRGMVTNSIVVLGVRRGNPKKITGWESLTRPGLQVLCPNPDTSGGAQWNINAIYGAGLKASTTKGGKGDPRAAADLLRRIRRNITVMDKSGRASMATFESGVGDVIITYENELLLRNLDQHRYDIVIPKATLLIENPVAVVDANADHHQVHQVADAFVWFLWTRAAQESFAHYGFRPVDPIVAKTFRAKYPTPPQLFTMDYFGGWAAVRETIYGPRGVWTALSHEK